MRSGTTKHMFSVQRSCPHRARFCSTLAPVAKHAKRQAINVRHWSIGQYLTIKKLTLAMRQSQASNNSNTDKQQQQPTNQPPPQPSSQPANQPTIKLQTSKPSNQATTQTRNQATKQATTQNLLDLGGSGKWVWAATQSHSTR